MYCKLCDNQAELCNSHIVPKFFYEKSGIYDHDSLHRMLRIDLPGKKTRWVQDGVKEPLLCQKCEKFLNEEFEKYACDIFYGEKGFLKSRPQKSFLIRGVDYQVFKLFQLSVLWRASIARDDFFAEVDLGPHHEEKIRKMLLNKNPGEPHEYCCFVCYLMSPPELPKDGFFRSPFSSRMKGGYRTYRLHYGGCAMLFIVASHFNDLRFGKFHLRKSGELPILVLKDLNDRFFTEMARDFQE